MCNLYRMTKNATEVAQLFDAVAEIGSNAGGEIYPGYSGIVIAGGKVETMDGPFAETKEQLGGYYQIDVPDLDTALRYAAMIPAVDYGTIEVRPVMDVGPMLDMAQ